MGRQQTNQPQTTNHNRNNKQPTRQLGGLGPQDPSVKKGPGVHLSATPSGSQPDKATEASKTQLKQQPNQTDQPTNTTTTATNKTNNRQDKHQKSGIAFLKLL